MGVWVGGGEVGGMGEGDLTPPSPVICKSHELVRLGCDTSTNGLGLVPTLAVARNSQTI